MKQKEYLEAEAQNNKSGYLVCWNLLLAVLREHSTSKAQGRRAAQSAWRNLSQKQNESIIDFHTRFDQVLTEYRRFYLTPSPEELLLHYLDSVDAEIAKYLSLHRRPEILQEARQSAREQFDIEEAYSRQDGKMPARQRSNWPNDRKLSGTPLQPGAGNNADGQYRTCNRCGGAGHEGM